MNTNPWKYLLAFLMVMSLVVVTPPVRADCACGYDDSYDDVEYHENGDNDDDADESDEDNGIMDTMEDAVDESVDFVEEAVEKTVEIMTGEE